VGRMINCRPKSVLTHIVFLSMIMTYPCFAQWLRNDTASSGGKSTTMKPLTPASLQSMINFSSPYLRMGL